MQDHKEGLIIVTSGTPRPAGDTGVSFEISVDSYLGADVYTCWALWEGGFEIEARYELDQPAQAGGWALSHAAVWRETRRPYEPGDTQRIPG